MWYTATHLHAVVVTLTLPVTHVYAQFNHPQGTYMGSLKTYC